MRGIFSLLLRSFSYIIDLGRASTESQGIWAGRAVEDILGESCTLSVEDHFDIRSSGLRHALKYQPKDLFK